MFLAESPLSERSWFEGSRLRSFHLAEDVELGDAVIVVVEYAPN